MEIEGKTQAQSKDCNIRTYVRIRPFNVRERETTGGVLTSCLLVKDQTILITNKNETTVVNADDDPKNAQSLLSDSSVKQFTYDHVFDSNCSQEDVFLDIGVKAI